MMSCMLSDRNWVTAMEHSLHEGHVVVNICKGHWMDLMGLHSICKQSYIWMLQFHMAAKCVAV